MSAIRSIQFQRPIEIDTIPGGTDFWSPSKAPGVTAAKREAGVLLSWTPKGSTGVRTSFVPLTNIAQITFDGEEPAPAKAVKP